MQLRRPALEAGVETIDLDGTEAMGKAAPPSVSDPLVSGKKRLHQKAVIEAEGRQATLLSKSNKQSLTLHDRLMIAASGGC